MNVLHSFFGQKSAAYNKLTTIVQTWLQAVINFLAIAVSTAIGILILKSLTECILYAQPMIVRMGKNVFAFVTDIFMLEFSLPICMSMDKPIKKTLKI